SDRNAAVRRHAAIATEIDATGRTVRSGASGRTLRVPDDVDLAALVSKGCQQPATLPAVRFFASGLSCGGVIALTRRGFGYEVRVNWLTGGIDVVPRSQG
ncbi:MAG: type II secretion system protein GspH, partial [Proteobacteria bacterium]